MAAELFNLGRGHVQQRIDSLPALLEQLGSLLEGGSARVRMLADVECWRGSKSIDLEHWLAPTGGS
jgi:hypothetical protein